MKNYIKGKTIITISKSKRNGENYLASLIEYYGLRQRFFFCPWSIFSLIAKLFLKQIVLPYCIY